MTDMIVFDFVAGAVLIRDRTGEMRNAPAVLELVAADLVSTPPAA